MHATVRIYSGANELADALVDRKDDVKQIISEIEGFKAYYLVRTSDGATSISVYDNEAGTEQSNRVAAAWVAENLPDLRVAAPQIAAGEVAISF